VKKTTTTLIEMKVQGEKIAALTAYDYILATILDEIGIDLILVGDSLGTVFAGYETTVQVTLDQMLYHTKIVSQQVKNALVVGDMPFMSFQISPDEAVRNAGRFLQEAGAEAVKLEGGEEIAPTVRRIVNAGIPVMGHLGLLPQSVHKYGGYAVRARESKEAEKLRQDAKILEECGAFSIVLEKIPHQLARQVSQSLSIPTIGIGAGPDCDGQILVTPDMLGLFERFHPPFVRRYAELNKEMKQACTAYLQDVRTEKFPSLEESF
jgi:3-methyl-2-oxobutanoate hydroxymethyltransferase